MADKTDLRREVSRKLIWDSMFSLLEEKPFSSISVKDICERAHINRSTFYNHYVDKYELLRYGLRDEVLKEAGLLDKLDLPSIDLLPHTALFQYVYEHQRFWTNIFVLEGMSAFAAEVLMESTTRFFHENEMTRQGKMPPPVITAQMYFGAVGMLTAWWLKEGCKTPIEQLNEWVDNVWRYGKRKNLSSPSMTIWYRD